MAPNPDPAHITDEMWRLWEERPNPAWKLSGIYANKRFYHNTVNANKKLWPGNYSITVPLDLNKKANYDKARAIDLTMSTAEMIKWTTRMKNSALNPADNRLAAVREFYGTLDGTTVYGLIKSTEKGTWHKSTSDKSHLWHGHTSIFTEFVDVWPKLSPINSVWRGESLQDWITQEMLPKQGDVGQEVAFWQYTHNYVRGMVVPASPAITVDSNYGPATAAAFKDFWTKSGGVGNYQGQVLTGWLAYQYNMNFAKRDNPKVVVPPPPAVVPKPDPIDPTVLKVIVNEWLENNVPDSFTIKGTLEGTLSNVNS